MNEYFGRQILNFGGFGKQNVLDPDFNNGTPTFERNSKWVKYGEKDNHPEFLRELYKRSNTHNTIVEAKVNMASGDGLEFYADETYNFLKDDVLRTAKMNLSEGEIENQIIEATDYFTRIGIFGEHEKIFWDFMTYGGAYLTIRKAKKASDGRNVRRQIIAVRRQKFRQARVGLQKFDGLDLVSQENFYCQNFERANKGNIVNYNTYIRYVNSGDPKQKKAVVKVPRFKIEGTDDTSSILLGRFTNYRDYYPTPDYENFGGTNGMLSDYELSKFDLNELRNGLQLQYIITIFRDPLSDKKKEREKQQQENEYWKENLTGTHNAGRFVIQRYAPRSDDDKRKGVEITEVPTNNNAETLNQKKESAESAIMIAHGVVIPEMFGLQGKTKSGLSDEAKKFEQGYKMYFWDRILPYRKPYVDFLNQLLVAEGLKIKVRVKDNVPIIKDISDGMWRYAFTENEYRENVGHKTLDEEGIEELRTNRTLTGTTKKENE